MSDFTEAQQRTIAEIVRQVLAAQSASSSGPQGPSGEPGPPGLDGAGNGTTRWNAGDLGFFDPLYDGKSASNSEAITHTGKDTYFRDVHLFIERAKDLATVKGAELVRDNLWTCLRGTALAWWTGEFSEDQKRMIKLTAGNNDQLGEWIRLLHGRFKAPSNIALEALIKEKYTLRDAANHREPREYAQCIVRLAKDAGLDSLQNQLDIIYNGIDSSLRKGDIKRPKVSQGATLDGLMEDLDESKHDWWDYGSKALRGSQSNRLPSNANLQSNRSTGRRDDRGASSFGQYNQYNSRSQGFNAYRPFSNNSQFQPRYPPSNAYQNNQYSQQQRPTYQPNQGYQGYPGYQGQNRFGQSAQSQGYGQNQQGQSGQYLNQRQLPPSRPQLQLTAGQASVAGSNSTQRSSLKPFGNAYRPQRAYQASVSEDVDTDKLDENSDHGYHRDAHHGETDEDWKDEQEYSDYGQEDYQDINFVMAASQSVREHQCTRCNTTYSSRNLLFKHLRDQCWVKTAPEDVVEQSQLEPCSANHITASFIRSSRTTVTSTVVPDQSKESAGYAFRNWRYATTKLWLEFNSLMSENSKKPEAEDCCLDFGCPVTLGDRSFMQRHLGEAMVVHKLASPLSVRGVGGKMLRTSEYVTACICLDATDSEQQPIIARLFAEIHLVDDLAANLLLVTDVLVPQEMVLNFKDRLVRIGTCNATAPIDVVARKDDIKRTVRVRKAFVIPPSQTVNVPITYQRPGGNFLLSEDRDYLFEPQCSHHLGDQGGVYAHLADFIFSFVQVHNASSCPVELPRRARLGTLVEYNQQECYLATSDEAATVRPTHSWKSKRSLTNWRNKMVKAAAVAAYAVASLGAQAPVNNSSASIPVNIDLSLEYTCINGVIIYGQPTAVATLHSIVDEYQDLFIDQGTTVDISEDQWMPINLKPGATAKPFKVYSLGQKDREVVDTTFDKLHA